jgi:hypothetical protein
MGKCTKDCASGALIPGGITGHTVFLGGRDVVDGTWPDHHNQAVILVVQHVRNIGAAFLDSVESGCKSTSAT